MRINDYLSFPNWNLTSFTAPIKALYNGISRFFPTLSLDNTKWYKNHRYLVAVIAVGAIGYASYHVVLRALKADETNAKDVKGNPTDTKLIDTKQETTPTPAEQERTEFVDFVDENFFDDTSGKIHVGNPQDATFEDMAASMLRDKNKTCLALKTEISVFKGSDLLEKSEIIHKVLTLSVEHGIWQMTDKGNQITWPTQLADLKSMLTSLKKEEPYTFTRAKGEQVTVTLVKNE